MAARYRESRGKLRNFLRAGRTPAAMSGEHERSPAPSPLEPEHPDAKQVGPSPRVYGPEPKQVDKLGARWDLTPDSIEHEAEVGRPSMLRTPIFARGFEQGPRFQARISGSSSLRYAAGPLHLPGSRAPHDPNNDLVVKAMPTEGGRHRGTLEIEILDAPRESHRIPIVVEAHVAGRPTLREEERQHDERAQRERDGKEAADKLAREREAIKKDEQLDYHVHSNAYGALLRERTFAAGKLAAVYQTRRAGIESAGRELAGFVRRKPVPEQPSLLLQLAGMAMVAASGGIAAAIASTLKPLVVSALTRTVEEVVDVPFGDGSFQEKRTKQVEPSNALVALVTDSIKQLVKNVAKPSTETAVESKDAPVSADALNAFLTAQTDSLIATESDTADRVTYHLVQLLKPRFRDKPGATRWPNGAPGAVDAMRHVGEVAAAERGSALNRQADETVRHWLRYLTQESLGSVTASEAAKTGMQTLGSGGSLTNVAALGDSSRRNSRYDGLIDVTFLANQAEPREPIRVTGVRLLGVRRAVVKRLQHRKLGELELPVRAISRLSPEQTVVAARDEAGNVSYSDTTGGNVSSGSWFARRIGVRAHVRPGHQEQGARELLANEVLNKSMVQLAIGTENDSDEE